MVVVDGSKPAAVASNRFNRGAFEVSKVLQNSEVS